MALTRKTVLVLGAGASCDYVLRTARQLLLDRLFREHGYGHRMGDLGFLEPNREAFKVRVAEVHPDKTAGAIASSEGQTL